MNEKEWLSRPCLSPDDGGGAGSTPIADPVVVDIAEPVAEPAPLPPAPTLPDPAMSQLLMVQAEQSRAMQAMADRLEAMSKPKVAPEDDLRTPEEKQLAELTQYMREQKVEREQAKLSGMVQGVVADASNLLDRYIASDPFTAVNTAAAEAIKTQVLSGVRAAVQAAGFNHSVTEQGVAHLFRQLTESTRKIVESHPGYTAKIAEAQKGVVNRAVDTPGSVSPKPADGLAPPLDPDSDEFWQSKKKLAAAFRSRTGQ